MGRHPDGGFAGRSGSAARRLDNLERPTPTGQVIPAAPFPTRPCRANPRLSCLAAPLLAAPRPSSPLRTATILPFLADPCGSRPIPSMPLLPSLAIALQAPPSHSEPILPFRSSPNQAHRLLAAPLLPHHSLPVRTQPNRYFPCRSCRSVCTSLTTRRLSCHCEPCGRTPQNGRTGI